MPICLTPLSGLPEPLTWRLVSKTNQKSYTITKIQTFTTKDMAKPDTENIRGLDLKGMKLATV
jgi:hypothetical protein